MSVPMMFQFDSDSYPHSTHPPSGNEPDEVQPLMKSSSPDSDYPMTQLNTSAQPIVNGHSRPHVMSSSPHGQAIPKGSVFSSRPSDTPLQDISEYLEPSKTPVFSPHSNSTDSGVSAFSNRDSSASRGSESSSRNSHTRPSSGQSVSHIHPVVCHDPAAEWTMDSYNNSCHSSKSIPPLSLPASPTRRPESLAVVGHVYEDLPLKPQSPTNNYEYAEPRPDMPGPSGPMSAKYPPSSMSISQQNSVCESTVTRVSRDNMMDAVDTNQNTYRKRRNPLYNTMSECRASKGETKMALSQQASYRCYCISIVFVALVACAALLLTLLHITGTLGTNSDSDAPASAGQVSDPLREALRRLDDLQARYDNLLAKYEGVITDVDHLRNRSQLHSEALKNSSSVADLQGDLVHNISNLISDVVQDVRSQNVTIGAIVARASDLTSEVDSLGDIATSYPALIMNASEQALRMRQIESDLAQSESLFRMDLADLRSEFQVKISNVSKIVGPRGPAGVGNLTACTTRTFSQGTSGGTEASTLWFPSSLEQTQMWVVLGAECSTQTGEGVSTFLDKEIKWGEQRYKCTCSSAQNQRFFCFMDLWMCPRLS